MRKLSLTAVQASSPGKDKEANLAARAKGQ
jgi:hypothetical protein